MVVKTYHCHHKHGFKVKDKVAALQIQELWTDMEYTTYFSSRIMEESLWKKYSSQFCEHICTYLVSGASYSRLNNATQEVTKDSSGLAQPFRHNQHQPRVWAAYTSFRATKCCWVTTVWFEDRGCVVVPVHAKESSFSMRSQHAQAPSSQFCCLFI